MQRLHLLAGGLVRWQVRHPWLVLLAVLLTLIPSVLVTTRLELKTSFQDLLPPQLPSVLEQRRLDARLGGTGTLIVVVEGGNGGDQRRFVDAISPRIRALGPSWVKGVDDGMRHLRDFAEKHWFVYASVADLNALGDELTEAKDQEIMKRAGFDLELDGAEDANRPWTREALQRRLRAPTPQAFGQSLPDYYVSDDGTLGAIVVRTAFGPSDARLEGLTARIADLSRQTQAELGIRGLHVRFTGSVVTGAEEHRAVVRDLTHVGVLGVALVLGIVFLYFLRVRALLALTATIVTGCVWSFALASLAVGHLNSASGFLVSIIAGNGINFGIVYMARYLEARHDDRLGVEDAIARSHRETWAGTLTAAAAASVAYGSLAVTQFPAFRHFGIIGGGGLLLCWAATYSLLPAILVLSERAWPLEFKDDDWRRRVQGLFAGPLYSLASRFPRSVALAALAVVLAGAAATARYVAEDPTEYDLRNIRNDDADPDSARVLARRVAPLVGPLSRDGRAMVVDDLGQLQPLVQELRRRRDSASPDSIPFDRVVSVLDLVPPDQESKVAAAIRIVDVVRYARRRGLVSDEDWSNLAPLLHEPGAVAMADLPDSVSWRFEEADGTRGRVVYLVPTAGRSLNDARYLMLWADSFRAVPLPDGTVVHGSGDPVVFSDLLESIRQEAPRAILVSLLGTVVVVLGAFRLRGAGWLSLGCIVGGMCALVGLLFALPLKLNFLNFMALPITIGVGADYAVNVLRRRELMAGRSTERAFVQTGGAVMLCSLTTILGYSALLRSINGAVRSFGLAAAAGEVTMILATTLFLPAVLSWLENSAGPRVHALVSGRGHSP